MSDVAVRYLTMLSAIPVEPRSVTAKELVSYLAQEGFKVSVRSVQRDLEKLCTKFPLQSDENSRPYRWYFGKDANLSIIPSLDSSTALTFELARAYLAPVLPLRTLQKLQPHFEAAQKTLQRPSELGKWPDKVRVISRGLGAQPSEIDADVLEAVTEALLTEVQCRLTYKGRRWPEPQEIVVHPYGLVFRSPNVYLICGIEGREGVRQLVLHRASHSELLTLPVDKPEGFDLGDYIKSGNMGLLHSEDPVRLRLRCDKPVLNHLLESPLAEDQQVNDLTEEQFELTATLNDTQDLRWWLTAQAGHLDIVEPKWLRDEVRQTLENAVRRVLVATEEVAVEE